MKSFLVKMAALGQIVDKCFLSKSIVHVRVTRTEHFEPFFLIKLAFSRHFWLFAIHSIWSPWCSDGLIDSFWPSHLICNNPFSFPKARTLMLAICDVGICCFYYCNWLIGFFFSCIIILAWSHTCNHRMLGMIMRQFIYICLAKLYKPRWISWWCQEE